MIVTFAQWADWVRGNRIWLASLATAVAINFCLFWLASIAPMGRLAGMDMTSRVSPVEIVMPRRIPPPPDLSNLTDAPPSSLPLRFRPQNRMLRAHPGIDTNTPVSALRLRLNLNPCDPAADDGIEKPECAPPSQWQRADRDASVLLGAKAQGYTLDEVAVARGWIKPKPSRGQDSMAAKTDMTLPGSIFQDPPFPPPPIEKTAGP